VTIKTAEVSRGQRDPDEEVPARQPVKDPDPGRQGGRWDSVSIAPMRAVPGVVPPWGVEVQAEVAAEEPQLPCLFVGPPESVRGV